jgi:hypothetical protein
MSVSAPSRKGPVVGAVLTALVKTYPDLFDGSAPPLQRFAVRTKRRKT